MPADRTEAGGAGGEPRVHFLMSLAHPRGRRDRPPPRPPRPPDSPRAGWPWEAETGKWKLLGAPGGRVSQGSSPGLDEAKPPSGPLCSREDCSLASVEGTGLGPPHSPCITTGPRAVLSTPGSSPSPRGGGAVTARPWDAEPALLVEQRTARCRAERQLWGGAAAGGQQSGRGCWLPVLPSWGS